MYYHEELDGHSRLFCQLPLLRWAVERFAAEEYSQISLKADENERVAVSTLCVGLILKTPFTGTTGQRGYLPSISVCGVQKRGSKEAGDFSVFPVPRLSAVDSCSRGRFWTQTAQALCALGFHLEMGLGVSHFACMLLWYVWKPNHERGTQHTVCA